MLAVLLAIEAIYVEDRKGNAYCYTIYIDLYYFDDPYDEYSLGSSCKLINDNPRVYARLKESN